VPKESGDYKFFTSADDGVRLYINDENAIDDWQPHSQTMDTAARHLEAGQAYKIRLEYFESVGSVIVGFGVTRAEAFIGRETKALAAKADAVIICVGFDPKTEVRVLTEHSSFQADRTNLSVRLVLSTST